jgi:AcrR family transcriptional regulator
MPSRGTSGTAVATSHRRTQPERRSEAEHALLDAALRLFAAKGIDQTSLAEIGDEAGYSRGLVNHHFGSKAALVERLAERLQDEFVSRLAPIEPGAEIDALVAVAHAYLTATRLATSDARAFFVMWGAALPHDSALRPVFVADDARFRAGVESLVGCGKKNAAIGAGVDPVGFAVAFAGLLRGAAAQFLVDPGHVDLDAARAVAERFVRSGLQPTADQRTEGRAV